MALSTSQKTVSLASLEAYLGQLGAPTPLPSFPDADPVNNPNDIYRLYITDALSKLLDCDRALIYESLQRTSTPSKGDLVLVLPRLRLKGVKPSELAVELASKNRKKAIIEFSSPNIAKEFHAGHLRSTILGAFIANLYESQAGWDVVRLNYLGDWGKQFGLLAVGWQRYGSEAALRAAPLKHLLDVYVRVNADFRPEEAERKRARDEGRDTAAIESRGLFAERNAFFRRMEEGDGEALALWRRFRDISIERYVDIYARLGIRFDVYAGESQVDPATVAEVEVMLKARGVYEEDRGSWLIDFGKHGGAKAKHLGTAIVRGRTGTTTYLLRDVAAILDRARQYAFDEMVYVVSSEQDAYFQRVFATVRLLDHPDHPGLAARLRHVSFGKVMGMSTRLGKVELLGDILDRYAGAMHDVMRGNAAKYAQVEDPDAVADTVGIAAVMVQDMAGKRVNNYPFDMARMTSFEGDTGPYLQYCHARLSSLLRKASLAGVTVDVPTGSPDSDVEYSFLEDNHSAALLRTMAQYPDVVGIAFGNLEPSTVLTYLFRLAHQLSSSYDVLQVVGAPEGPRAALARAVLYENARQVLGNGMRLLGMKPVER
ncbi:arginyl-tRNA synthetase [Parathielavia hyrcaniae]|uniref:arginine--tRNA ligase n=1 Tax=Parathielavia hyrcaniae TaxID=113614 RepID=A0AAN6T1N8_9PEZI|nr:arginyl-tRNA synthetase [Parathielavia hyrcaniae]